MALLGAFEELIMVQWSQEWTLNPAWLVALQEEKETEMQHWALREPSGETKPTNL